MFPINIESAEPVPQLQAGLPPVPLKYIPLPVPLPAVDTNTVTITVTETPGSPCRRCLQDAKPGENVHLLNYDPFPADSVSPYRGTMAIFVHAYDCAWFDGNKLPDLQLKRLLSLRVFDENEMMIAAEVVEGSEFEKVAGEMLADEKAKFLNVHNAKPGCFAVRVERK